MVAAPARRPLSEVISRRKSPLRRAYQIGASLLVWALIAYCWYALFLRPLDRWVAPASALLALVLLGILAVHSLHVSYDRGIYRQRPIRGHVRRGASAPWRDRLGRPLEGAGADKAVQPSTSATKARALPNSRSD